MFSAKAIEKLLSIEEYTYPIDCFYWCLSTGDAYKIHHPKSECFEYVNWLDVYSSSAKLVELSSDLGSSLADMRAEL